MVPCQIESHRYHPVTVPSPSRPMMGRRQTSREKNFILSAAAVEEWGRWLLVWAQDIQTNLEKEAEEGAEKGVQVFAHWPQS